MIGRLGQGLGVLAMLLVSFPAWASIDASLSEESSEVGSTVEFTVQLDGTHGNIEPVLELPDAIEILGRGQSSSISTVRMGTGPAKIERSIRYNYRLRANTQGTHRFVLKVGNETQDFVLTSVQGATPLPDREIKAQPELARKTAFILPKISKQSVYVGESFTYSVELWERSNSSFQWQSPPSFKDFWSEELKTAQTRLDQVARQRFQVHEIMRKQLFAQQPGMLTIDSGEILMQQVQIFAINPIRNQSITSPPLTIEVKALPEKNKPPNFSPSNVGVYELHANLDRTELNPGDAVKLTIEIEGRGNLRMLELPAWPSPAQENLRVYDPSASEIELENREGEVYAHRSYEFLLIPDAAGIIELPPFTIDVFNPDSERYETLRSDAFVLKVLGPEGEQALPNTPSPLQDSDELLLAPTIHGLDYQLHTPQPRLLSLRQFLVILGGILGGLFSIDLFCSLWRKRNSTPENQRRKRITTLEAMLNDPSQDFWITFESLLSELASERLARSIRGESRASIIAELHRKKVSSSWIETWKNLSETCEHGRYSGVNEIAQAQKQQYRSQLQSLRKGGW